MNEYIVSHGEGTEGVKLAPVRSRHGRTKIAQDRVREAMAGLEVTGVSGELVGQLDEALGFLRRRLLGEVPAVFTALESLLADSFWESHADSGVAIQLSTVESVDGAPLAEEELSDAELAAIDQEVADHAAWEESRVGEAETNHQYRLSEFIQHRRHETDRLRLAWLEEQAEQHERALAEWLRQRRTDLAATFELREATLYQSGDAS